MFTGPSPTAPAPALPTSESTPLSTHNLCLGSPLTPLPSSTTPDPWLPNKCPFPSPLPRPHPDLPRLLKHLLWPLDKAQLPGQPHVPATSAPTTLPPGPWLCPQGLDFASLFPEAAPCPVCPLACPHPDAFTWLIQSFSPQWKHRPFGDSPLTRRGGTPSSAPVLCAPLNVQKT